VGIPYDDELLGSQKTLRGFLRSEDLLNRVISTPGSQERAAKELGVAIERQSDAMVKISGTRQIFLFLHAGCADWLGGRLEQLIESVRSGNVAVHGFAPEGAADCGPFRELCLAAKGGTFHTAPPEELPGIIEGIYSGLLNRYELTYRVPGEPAAEGKLLITSELGCGKAEFALVNG
jgi:hypothetical protein